jgi:hypothetical protein
MRNANANPSTTLCLATVIPAPAGIQKRLQPTTLLILGIFWIPAQGRNDEAGVGMKYQV